MSRHYPSVTATPGEDPLPPERFEGPSSRRVLTEEISVVLSLSLLASAVFAVIDLLSAPVRRTVTVRVFQNVQLASQLASIVFSLAPAGVGFGLYVASIALNINRFVVPVPPLGHWWTVPVLVLGALQNALLEEVVVVGYLIRRLEQIGWPGPAALLGSAVLRGAYHLYQGWGGFAGNLLLGLAFGLIFLRWRRTWPLVTAHFLVDAMAGIAYMALRGHCYFGVCIS